MQSLLNRKQSVAACTPVGHGKSMEHITHTASYIYIENVLIHFGYVQLEFPIASSGPLLQSIVLTFRVIRVKAGRGVFSGKINSFCTTQCVMLDFMMAICIL